MELMSERDSLVAFDCLNETEFQASLLTDVEATQPGEQVSIVTMGFNPAEAATRRLIDQGLVPAAERGAHVSLGVDGYAFMFDEQFRPTGPLVLGRDVRASSNPYFQQKVEALDYLGDQGVNWGIVHAPKGRLHIPYAGRSHIKGATAGGAFYLGGCGLDFTETPDSMLRGVSPRVTGQLNHTFGQLIDGKRMSGLLDADTVTSIDADTYLYTDRGKRGSSFIMDQTIEFIDNAEDWLMISCQFFPSGKTAKALARAINERGVAVYNFYNNERNRRLGGSIMNLLKAKDRRSLPPQLFDYELPPDSRFIHAKILASEKGGMNGSHNYITQGVTLGTAEMTIHRNSPEFGVMLGKKLLQIVNWDRNFAGLPLPDIFTGDDGAASSLMVAAL